EVTGRAQRLTEAAIALVVLGLAWAYAATVLRHTRPMGLPLDDSYIYLTYAKQFGRGQPFTYYPGGGYSAGATSILWPMLLAPFWTLGLRGHALVWVSFVLSAGLIAVTAIGVRRLIAPIAGPVAAGLSVVVLLAIAPVSMIGLSGMEVALASALLVTTIRWLIAAPGEGGPGWPLGLCLAATSLARPEAMLMVGGVCGAMAIARRRTWRAALAWLAPLAAPVAWLVANRLLAGHWMPNTGVAKSHFYLPGFDWAAWRRDVWQLTGAMLRGLFWDAASPLVAPRLFALVWLAGAIRVLRWARRERHVLAGLMIVAGPFALVLAVIASSGLWSFQGYRYVTPAFPLLVVAAGSALGSPARTWHTALGAVAVAGFAIAGLGPLVTSVKTYAQGAMDTNTQVVEIGEYLHRKLPGAPVLLHDAGAIAYYGDGPVYDMLGLVTNHQAEVASNGPGARFEFLERLPADQRFRYFTYYPGWLGTDEFFGADLLHTRLRPGFSPQRWVGDSDMQILEARWDHAGSGERPLTGHDGWAVVDRLDIADLASEVAHAWRGALGSRRFGDATARWSVVGREVGDRGLVLDGGRTIRGGREAFAITAAADRPIRLILRTGGARSYPMHEAITAPVALEILDDADRVLARNVLPAPAGPFQEVAFELPANTPRQLHTRAAAPYRAFHWFILQPE
ncbi:MAG TPA: hypothetical protein VGC42_19410, partial [Kofleriaceae bacterium]